MADMFKFAADVSEEATQPHREDSLLSQALQEWIDAEVLERPLVEDDDTHKDYAFLKAHIPRVNEGALILSHAFKHLFVLSKLRVDKPRVRIQCSLLSGYSLEKICTLAKASNLSQWTQHPARFAALLILCKARFRNAMIHWQKIAGK